MEKGKFYLFKITGWKEPIGGIIESIGLKWLLIKHIVGDYTLDGYTLIQRKYIRNYIYDDEVLFTEKVLLAKGVMDTNIPYNIPLDTQTDPFIWLKEHNITARFNPKNASICYVGKVEKMTIRFFQFISLNSKGCWDVSIYKHTYANTKTIDLDCDYINSLLIYNAKMQK